MSNWAPKPKYTIAEGDTCTKSSGDETYPYLQVIFPVASRSFRSELSTGMPQGK